MRNSNKQKKSAQKLKIEVFKIYKLEDLWQRHTEQIISQANTPDNLVFPRKLRLISRNDFIISLSNIPHGYKPPLSKKKIKRNSYVNELKTLSWLLKLVSK